MRRSATLRLLMMTGLQAIYEYWNGDGHNEVSAAGVKLIEFSFSCVWAWDARPFPISPLLTSQWSDGANWRTGNWLRGRGPALLPPAAACRRRRTTPGAYPSFPALTTLWLVGALSQPRFATRRGRPRLRWQRAGGRRYAATLYDSSS